MDEIRLYKCPECSMPVFYDGKELPAVSMSRDGKEICPKCMTLHGRTVEMVLLNETRYSLKDIEKIYESKEFIAHQKFYVVEHKKLGGTLPCFIKQNPGAVRDILGRFNE